MPGPCEREERRDRGAPCIELAYRISNSRVDRVFSVAVVVVAAAVAFDFVADSQSRFFFIFTLLAIGKVNFFYLVDRSRKVALESE